MDRLLVRMAMWVRRPPPRRFIAAAVAAVILAAAVVALERAGYWPQWAETERVNRRGVPVEAGPIE